MLSEKILNELKVYVDNHLIFVPMEMEAKLFSENMEESVLYDELDDFVQEKRQPTFQQVLFNFIDKKAARDSAIYKKARIDRRHFSKIRSNPDYLPRKNTVIALALALELNHKHTNELLDAAGYSLSFSETFDLVIQFCLEKKIYDMDYVNQALENFSLKPLIE